MLGWLRRLRVAVGGACDATVRAAEEEFERSRRPRVGYGATADDDVAFASNEQIDELPEE